MGRYALVERETGVVQNVIEYDPQTSDWIPPDTQLLIATPNKGSPGDTYNLATGVFTAPPPPPQAAEPPSLEQRLLALEAWQKATQQGT